MQLYSVLVRKAGDLSNTLQPRNRGWGPGIVSWPEVCVLRAVHGGADTVLLLEDAGKVEAPTSRAEKARLLSFGYPRAVVERLYPGGNPQMDFDPELDDPMLPDVEVSRTAATAASVPRKGKQPKGEAA